MGLKEDILARQDLAELVAARNDAAIAAAMYPGRKKVVSRLGGVGTVMRALGPVEGATLVFNLENLVSMDVPGTLPLKYALRLLDKDDLDFGDPVTRGQLDALVEQGVITQQDADGLKAIAEIPDPVSVTEVSEALNA